MAAVLSDEEIRTALEGLPAWSGGPDGIRREVKASDFVTAIRIVDAVAEVAEASDHHPDIDIRWRTLTFVLVTHSAGGVTAKDVELARRIDEIAAGHGVGG